MKTLAGATLLRPAAAADAAHANERGEQAIAYWLLLCCAMIFLMVVIGGITRLTLSGLSITEWQPVTGIVPPLSEAAWVAEFEKYQQIPQYKLLNAGMSLGEFKSIFLWEYVHRLWGRLIGFVYALPLLYFLMRRQIPRRLMLPLAGIFLLGFAQGALGWYMVKSGLSDRVSVSQYRLVAHLALALAIYALTLWIALGILARTKPSPASREGAAAQRRWVRAWQRVRLRPSPQPSPPAGRGSVRRWRRAAEAMIGLVALTIAAGGFVAGLHAGLIYNTFPLMDGSFVPSGYAALKPFVLNWFETIAAVQFNHRLLAMTTAACRGAALAGGEAGGAAAPGPSRVASRCSPPPCCNSRSASRRCCSSCRSRSAPRIRPARFCC